MLLSWRAIFEGEPPVGHGEDFNRDQFERANRPSHARGCSIEGSCASLWVRRRRDGVGASFQNRICIDVRFDRGGRQETSSRDRRWKWTMCIMRIWCKSVRSKYGYRGVRVGEAINPGPPKWLRRTPSARDGRGSVPPSTNKFEILSSSDDEPLVPDSILLGDESWARQRSAHSASVVRRSSQGFG